MMEARVSVFKSSVRADVTMMDSLMRTLPYDDTLRERTSALVLRYTLSDYIKRSTVVAIPSGLCGRWQFRSPSSLWKRKELRQKTMVFSLFSSGVWTKKRSHAATKSYVSGSFNR